KLNRISRGSQDSFSNTIALTKFLISKSMPADGESFDPFRSACEQGESDKWLNETRRLELAFFAPQWSRWIERMDSTEGLEEAVTWFWAHLEPSWSWQTAGSVLSALKDTDRFAAENITHVRPSRPSPLATLPHCSLSNPECWEIDSQWFVRIRCTPDDWLRFCDVLHTIATPQQCKRMRRIIDALLGKLSVEQAAKESDADTREIQLLSLVPVKQGAERESDLAERMRVLLDHRRKANRLKAMKREKALEANDNAKRMLAARAGIEDSQRLDWFAMADVQQRIDSVSPLEIDGVNLSLIVQANGLSTVRVVKDGKPQKSIPTKLGKRKEVQDLKELNKELRQLGRETARSLERAMASAAEFDVAEMKRLLSNPLVEPPLTSLLLLQGDRIGTLSAGETGPTLTDVDGKTHVLTADVACRIAHVTDLFDAGCLAEWRAQFADRVQAFEQVHRDVFRPTKAELAGKDSTITRFADHPVREDQAFAILTRYGWRQLPEASWQYEKRDAATETLCLTETEASDSIGQLRFPTVWFVDADERTLPLSDVSPRFLSECIRMVNAIVTTAEADDDDE
ncbi:MAG: DUF4132 domain-containing protein, partial [Planctomycetota bacterium]